MVRLVVHPLGGGHPSAGVASGATRLVARSALPGDGLRPARKLGVSVGGWTAAGRTIAAAGRATCGDRLLSPPTGLCAWKPEAVERAARRRRNPETRRSSHAERSRRRCTNDGFTAPELADDPAREPRPTADIYGLAAILYAMLTGSPPTADSEPASKQSPGDSARNRSPLRRGACNGIPGIATPGPTTCWRNSGNSCKKRKPPPRRERRNGGRVRVRHRCECSFVRVRNGQASGD